MGFMRPKFQNFKVIQISLFFLFAKVFFDKLAVKVKQNQSNKNPEILQYDFALA